MDSSYFMDCRLEGIALNTLEPVYKNKYDTVRLYIVKNHIYGAVAYDAILVEFVSASAKTATMWEDDKELRVSVVFSCYGNSFDGCKHFFFSPEEENGYYYYPPVEDIIEALKIIDGFQDPK